MDANKSKALEAALGQIERQFGKGTVMRMGENARQAYPLFLPVPWAWILLWALAVCPRGEWLRSTGQNLQVKQH